MHLYFTALTSFRCHFVHKMPLSIPTNELHICAKTFEIAWTVQKLLHGLEFFLALGIQHMQGGAGAILS